MCSPRITATVDAMTTLEQPTSAVTVRAPLSSLARTLAGLSLIAAAVTNGLSQYLMEAVYGGHDSFSDQILWGVGRTSHQLEQSSLMISAFFLPIGLLGILQVTRWTVPRLTLAAGLLVAWGMWGFHNVIALGYAAGTVAPGVGGVEDAVRLNEGLVDHAGVAATALYPHLIGSFFGLILLSAAAWRSGAFPRLPLVLLVGFLVWDFVLPSSGALEPHLLLFVALAWLGVHVLRMSPRTWVGQTGPRG